MKRTLITPLAWIVLVCVQAQPKQMCITIDDLPVVSYTKTDLEFLSEVTEALVATFDAFKIPAIGYVNESKLYHNGQLDPGRVKLLELWLQNGYELGNHTYAHKNYHRVSFAEYAEDIIKGEQVTKPLVQEYGMEYQFFRHPYLRIGSTKAHHDSLKQFLDKKGYREAPVTIDNEDYLFAKAYHLAYMDNDTSTVKKIAATYLTYMEKKLLYYEDMAERLLGRSMKQTLLLHANLLNAHYLDDLARMYQSHGYVFISQGEVLKDDAYDKPITKYGDWGISWLDRWALSQGKKGEFFKGDPVTPGFVREMAK